MQLSAKCKLEVNQELLEKAKAIENGEVITVKTITTGIIKKEIKFLLKKCANCGELFFQKEKGKHVFVNCRACSKFNKRLPHEILEEKKEAEQALNTLQRLENEAQERNKFLVKYK